MSSIKKNNKGFTLVELIVVLVILAILASMLVPALTGYIDRSKQEKLKLTTRQVVVAAQTVVSEAYGECNGSFSSQIIHVLTFGNTITIPQGGTGNDTLTSEEIAEILTRSEIVTDDFSLLADGRTTGQFKENIDIVGIGFDKFGKVTDIYIHTNTNLYCQYDGSTGEYTVSKY